MNGKNCIVGLKLRQLMVEDDGSIFLREVGEYPVVERHSPGEVVLSLNTVKTSLLKN
jgi:hypothetical protein